MRTPSLTLYSPKASRNAMRLFDVPFGPNDLQILLVGAVTGTAIHRGGSCRFALRVPSPLEEDEQKKHTRQQTHRS